MTHPAFAQMVAAAELLGLPMNYRDDLFVHDKFILDGNPELSKFGWVLYESGTHFISHPSCSGDSNIRLQAAAAALCQITRGNTLDGHLFLYEKGLLSPAPTSSDFLLWFVDGDRSAWEYRFSLAPCPYCNHRVPTALGQEARSTIYVCPDCRQVCTIGRGGYLQERKPIPAWSV